MGDLYKLRVAIEEHIHQKNLDEKAVKGKIGMKSGILLAIINESTPDDAEKIAKLKQAASEALGVQF